MRVQRIHVQVGGHASGCGSPPARQAKLSALRNGLLSVPLHLRNRLDHLHPSLMWERTLQDLIRGLRANKKDDAKFIAQAVDEIRQEIRSKDMELKAGAVLKLTYVRHTLSRKLSVSNAVMKS